MNSKIEILNGNINNLKNINVLLENGLYYVLAGPSGSGKSSLAFDILYTEALSKNKAKGTQKESNRSPKKYQVKNLPNLTVGIEQHCSPQLEVCSIGWYSGFIQEVMCKNNAQDTNFWCMNCAGKGYINSIDPYRVIRNPRKPLTDGAVTPEVKKNAHFNPQLWKKMCAKYKIDYKTAYNKIPKQIQKILLYGDKKEFKGFVTNLKFLLHTNKQSNFLKNEFPFYVNKVECNNCKGTGLSQKYVSVIKDKTIKDLFLDNKLYMSFWEKKWLSDLELENLNLDSPIFELSSTQARKLHFFFNVRGIPDNSLIILDEPCVGLLPIEISKIINVFLEIAKLGHTLLIVEHSPEVIKSADQIIAFGPGSGINGGSIVFKGTPSKYLNNIVFSKIDEVKKLLPEKESLNIKNNKNKFLSAKFNNWNGFSTFDINFPLMSLVCISGPGGSGKSSYLDAVYAACDKTTSAWQSKIKITDITGQAHIRRPYKIDTNPIGRNKGSTPATFLGFWNSIRLVFEAQSEAKKLCYTKSFFSFNTKEGKCSRCNGNAYIKNGKICPDCKGKRFDQKVLDIKFKGKNIAEVNNLTVEEACILFNEESNVIRYLNFLSFVALDYLVLGQPSYSLSGGELQRIKIASKLGKKLGDRSIYILDIPSRGLDKNLIPKLFTSMQKLVKKNNTVIIAENKPDIAARSDWLILLGIPLSKKMNILYSGHTKDCPVELWHEYMGDYPAPINH